jgi:dipeptidyl aminopeptidase/acylaminoacyl peptidase
MSHLARIFVICVGLLMPLRAQQPVPAAQPQGQFVTPPSTLVVDGAPPLPKAMMDALEPYAGFKFVVFSSWHPTERQMLVKTRFGDTIQAGLVSSPTAPMKQVTFRDGSIGSWDPGTGNVWFAEGGRSIVFAQSQGGTGFAQLFRQSVDGGNATMLTDGKSMNLQPVFSRKGDRIAYVSTRRNGKDRDLWCIDPSDVKTDRMVAQLQGSWSPLDWSPDDKFVLAMQTLAVYDTQLWQIDVATGEKKRLTPEGHAAYSGGQYSSDGRSVYTTSDAAGDFKNLVRLDLATGAVVALTPSIKWDVEEFKVSPGGRWVAFVANEAGAGTLYLLETRTGRDRRVKGLPVGQVSDVQWRPGAEELSFDMRSTKQPWTVYSLDVKTGRLERWTKPETGSVDTSQLADAEIVRWKSFDGLEISGVMYRPPARFKGPRPVVVNIHGGPEEQERPRFLGRSNYLLNELGVAIIYPNIRGSRGFGKTFMSLDNGMLRENAFKDVTALLDWIARQKDLDKSRVSLAGASYGGTVALAAAAANAGRVKCVFDGFGMSNIATWLDRLNPATKPVRRPEYGDETDPATREYLTRIAPLTHADKLRMPVYITHGRNDTSVSVQESEQMVAALKKNGTTLWTVYATNQGHGFSTSKANDDYAQALWMLFLKEYQLAPSGTSSAASRLQ